ncbi:hypothetical protein ACFS3C_10110 [Azotobacter vinelandii]
MQVDQPSNRRVPNSNSKNSIAPAPPKPSPLASGNASPRNASITSTQHPIAKRSLLSPAPNRTSLDFNHRSVATGVADKGRPPHRTIGKPPTNGKKQKNKKMNFFLKK